MSLKGVILLIASVKSRNKKMPKALMSNMVAMAMAKPKVKMRSLAFEADSLGKYRSIINAIKKVVRSAGLKVLRNLPELSVRSRKIPGM